jgi:hypothetical protein
VSCKPDRRLSTMLGGNKRSRREFGSLAAARGRGCHS